MPGIGATERLPVSDLNRVSGAVSCLQTGTTVCNRLQNLDVVRLSGHPLKGAQLLIAKTGTPSPVNRKGRANWSVVTRKGVTFGLDDVPVNDKGWSYFDRGFVFSGIRRDGLVEFVLCHEISSKFD